MYIHDDDAVRSNIEFERNIRFGDVFERNIRFGDVFKGGKINI